MSYETAENILAYHQRTRHRPEAYAKGPESIDWDAQPDPFRTYHLDNARGYAAAQIPLSLTSFKGEQRTLQWQEIWQQAHPGGNNPERGDGQVIADKDSLAVLLQLSLALSAWKQFGNAKWSLRINPSSGNLHPTECYVVASNIAGLAVGIYHYRADTHALEQRCRFIEKSVDHKPLLWLGFSSVHWREAWKYGERAYRYCQLDIGHALAAVSYAAQASGFSGAQIVPVAVADEQLDALLGIQRDEDFIRDDGVSAEREYGDCLISLTGVQQRLNSMLFQADHGEWFGRANVLDARHFYQWPVIEDASRSSRRVHNIQPANGFHWAEPPLAAAGISATEQAATLIRQRRSAQSFMPDGEMGLNDFYTLLDHTLARQHLPPWNTLEQASDVHLFLFVHNVSGLDSGLYVLLRDPAAKELLAPLLRDQFVWQKAENAPAHLPFYQLLKAGTRRTAANLSCQQAIAGDSAFSLAMLADMQGVESQPWLYRQRLWQAGAIGQGLYLEAEAAGMRGTGIGCYYDDFVHDLLGFDQQQSRWQVLYHFTVGKPVIDHRITSWSPYQERG